MYAIRSYYGLNNGLSAIINMHHHEALFADPDGQKERFLAQWKQISEFFKDYPDQLLFEILNEPNGNLTANKWNIFLADALTTIRHRITSYNVCYTKLLRICKAIVSKN